MRCRKKIEIASHVTEKLQNTYNVMIIDKVPFNRIQNSQTFPVVRV